MATVSNIPASIEWRVYKGDTATLSIFIKDNDGNSVDLSGYTVSSEVRTSPDSADVLQTMIAHMEGNLVTLVIPDTSTLPKSAYFDVQLTKTSDATVWTVIKGTIKSEMDVTR